MRDPALDVWLGALTVACIAAVVAIALGGCATVTEGAARSRDEHFCLATPPEREDCDGEDNDCDSLIDEHWETPCEQDRPRLMVCDSVHRTDGSPPTCRELGAPAELAVPRHETVAVDRGSKRRSVSGMRP